MPKIQSNIITQKLDTEEISNIFDIKSATIEHPRTFTKLSKPIKQRKVITQKPKAPNRVLQLDIIKRHILPKNDHNVMKLKS